MKKYISSKKVCIYTIYIFSFSKTCPDQISNNWNIYLKPTFTGFIITRGINSVAENKVELYNPQNGRSCPLPDLPEKRFYRMQCGSLICGDRSCMDMNSWGSFSPAPVSLLQRRKDHLCWSLPGGGEVILLGGKYSPTTTEIVSADGSSSKSGWDLKYKTEWDISQQLSCD